MHDILFSLQRSGVIFLESYLFFVACLYVCVAIRRFGSACIVCASPEHNCLSRKEQKTAFSVVELVSCSSFSLKNQPLPHERACSHDNGQARFIPGNARFYWIPRCSRKVAPAYSRLNKPFSTSLGISCSKKMFIDFSDPPGRAMNPSIAPAS